MKKIITLITLTLLISCSDDRNENNTDPIVGNWLILTHVDANGNNLIEDCEINNNFDIYPNGGFKFTDYDEDQNNSSNCVEDPENGTWIKNSNNTYTLEANNESFIFTITGGKLTNTNSNGDIITFNKQ